MTLRGWGWGLCDIEGRGKKKMQWGDGGTNLS